MTRLAERLVTKVFQGDAEAHQLVVELLSHVTIAQMTEEQIDKLVKILKIGE